jgi:DNA modification methylase
VRYRSYDGSSALAAAELGIDFVGVEIDRHYLQEASRARDPRSLIPDRSSRISSRESRIRNQKEPGLRKEAGLFD